MRHELFWLRGPGITTARELSRHLFEEAKALFHSADTHRDFTTRYGEGRLWTAHQTVVLGCLSGIKFTALVEADHGKQMTSFIIPESCFEVPISDIDIRVLDSPGEPEAAQWN